MTPKQARWYGEYIKDFNATGASRRAFGLSDASAAVDGARMLRNAKVSAAIAAWKARQMDKMEITAEGVLQGLWKLATYDSRNLYDQDGNRIPVHLLDDVTAAAVAAVEDETTETTKEAVTTVRRNQKLRMAEKGQNLERLGKYFGLFGEEKFGATVATGAGGLSGDSIIKVVLVRPA